MASNKSTARKSDSRKVYPGDFRLFAKYVCPANPKRAIFRKSDSSLHLKPVRFESRSTEDTWDDGSPRWFRGGSCTVVGREFLTERAVREAKRYLGVKRKRVSRPKPEGKTSNDERLSPDFGKLDESVQVYGDSGVRTRVKTLPDGREIEVPVKPRSLQDMYDLQSPWH